MEIARRISFRTADRARLALTRNTRYTPAYVTYGRQDSNKKARVDLADSPAPTQADKSARENLAQTAKARGGSDQELGLRATRNRKGPRRLSMVEAGDRVGRR